jgi:hypothetical protein
MDDLTCRQCGTALTKPPTGRPPRWCSVGCRRAAEYEIRRISRHLEQLEERVLRMPDVDQMQVGFKRKPVLDGFGRTTTQQKAFVREQIATLEARLRVLLDDDELRPAGTGK